MEFTEREKIAIINILCLVMEADGVIHPHEETFLDNVFTQLDVTKETLRYSEDKDPFVYFDTVNEMSTEKREFAKEIFLQMAECDGYVDPRELSLINRLFIK